MLKDQFKFSMCDIRKAPSTAGKHFEGLRNVYSMGKSMRSSTLLAIKKVEGKG